MSPSDIFTDREHQHDTNYSRESLNTYLYINGYLIVDDKIAILLAKSQTYYDVSSRPIFERKLL